MTVGEQRGKEAVLLFRFGRGVSSLRLNSRRVHDASELSSGFEHGHKVARHLDGLVGLRIASHPGCSLTGPVRAKTTQFNQFAVFHGVDDGHHKAVYDGLGLHFGQAGRRSDPVDDLGFGHGEGAGERDPSTGDPTIPRRVMQLEGLVADPA